MTNEEASDWLYRIRSKAEDGRKKRGIINDD